MCVGSFFFLLFLLSGDSLISNNTMFVIATSLPDTFNSHFGSSLLIHKSTTAVQISQDLQGISRNGRLNCGPIFNTGFCQMLIGRRIKKKQQFHQTSFVNSHNLRNKANDFPLNFNFHIPLMSKKHIITSSKFISRYEVDSKHRNQY